MTEILEGKPEQVAAPRREAPVVATLRELGDLAAFSGSSLRALPETPRYLAEILRQAAAIMRATTVLMFLMNGFIGVSLANFAYFFLRSIGAADYTGLATGFAGPRIACPLMFGYVFASTVCCRMAAEIGAAKISEEIDAYETEGVNPMRYVVGTRVAAALLTAPVLAIVALLGYTFGTVVDVVHVLQGLSPAELLAVHWGAQSPRDQIAMTVQAIVIGCTCVLVACFYGYRTYGGPEQVGASVARSIVLNLVLVHVIDAFLIVLFYNNNVHAPLGG